MGTADRISFFCLINAVRFELWEKSRHYLKEKLVNKVQRLLVSLFHFGANKRQQLLKFAAPKKSSRNTITQNPKDIAKFPE